MENILLSINTRFKQTKRIRYIWQMSKKKPAEQFRQVFNNWLLKLTDPLPAPTPCFFHQHRVHADELTYYWPFARKSVRSSLKYGS